ncbi:hypothetical protein RRG08_034422 [Elysia crispata]|uniref:Uncharacterized protein n=1 Tax=Elysia crispata TaxID=231223 RepID=A0AAE1CWP9_9GAST|nr:hypothetical protein RRG08_034422 [Elysia crispata]
MTKAKDLMAWVCQLSSEWSPVLHSSFSSSLFSSSASSNSGEVVKHRPRPEMITSIYHMAVLHTSIPT